MFLGFGIPFLEAPFLALPVLPAEPAMGPLKFGRERWTSTARFLKFHCFHKSPELSFTKSHHPSGPSTYLSMEEETPSVTQLILPSADQH